MEKTMKARVQHKHDLESNWLKATNFTPLVGEIIVYDPDENYDYPRIKIGDGETNINSLPFITEDYAKIADIPTKPADIGALPSTTKIPSTLSELGEDSTHRVVTDAEKNAWNAKAEASAIPTKVSQLDNDSKFLTSFTESDPTVPDWAKEETKPSYSKSEVGLGNVDNVRQYSASNPPPYPVASVNGQTGKVHLGAADVGARPSIWMPTAQEVGALPDTYVPPDQTAAQVGADPAGTAAAAVIAHNTSTDSHGDLRLELKAINDRLTAFFDSDNQTLDELSEIVAYITSNKALIDSITTSKVSVADIINNLTTNVSTKPLSAAQGVVLSGLIDTLSKKLANYQPKGDYALRSEIPSVPVKSVNGKTGAVSLTAADVKARPDSWMPTASDVGALPSSTVIPTVPTKLSAFTNDSGFITGYTETDPTVPAWAKSASKPSYSKSEVGLGNVDNVKQYSASNPPPYPVTSVNGKTGVVTVDVPTVPTKVSAFTNDAGYLTQHQDISGKADKTGLTLGIHTDGLVYLFVDGAPVGSGIELSSGGVSGYVDENNNIILNNLPDGTYTVKYEMEDGSTIEIGDLVLDTNVYYSVTTNLTNCTSSNNATQAAQGGSYSATISAKSGYEMSSIKVTMGGTDISASAVSGGKITIGNVTGNIVITAVAEEKASEPVTVDIALIDGIRIGSDGGDRTLAGYCATERIDLRSIPKPCTINLTNAKWCSDGTSTSIRFFVANKSNAALDNGVTTIGTTNHFTVTDNNGDMKNVSVEVTSDDVGYIRFSGMWGGTGTNGNHATFENVKATLTYTPN